MTMAARLTQWLAKHGGHPYTQVNKEICSKLGLKGKDYEESCWTLLDEFEHGNLTNEDLIQGLCVATDLSPEEVVKRLG